MRVFFLVQPHVNMADLGGASQVFLMAKLQDVPFDLVYCATEGAVVTSAGLPLGSMRSYRGSQPGKGDLVIVASAYFGYVLSEAYDPPADLLRWLRGAHERGSLVCSLCNGAFLLAKARLLDGRECTTNWQRVEALRAVAPGARVHDDVLYCEDAGVFTSAGGAACFDLSLHLVARFGGGHLAHAISKQLVLNGLRQGTDRQVSAYLKHREHGHPGIHLVQDHLAAELHQAEGVAALAALAHMSERNFTRCFKRYTGLTVKQYVQELRVERAERLFRQPSLSREQVAAACGLRGDRQLRRILGKHAYTPTRPTA